MARRSEQLLMRSQQEFPLKDFGPKRINTFSDALRTKLSDKESNFGKDYLKLLVQEICIEGKVVRMHGKYADVVNVMQNTALGFPVGLLRTGRVWLPIAVAKYYPI